MKGTPRVYLSTKLMSTFFPRKMQLLQFVAGDLRLASERFCIWHPTVNSRPNDRVHHGTT